MTVPDQKLISVVVPCYNEGEMVETFLQTICGIAAKMSAYRFEFVFIDDGSTDNTEAMLEAAARQDERVRALVLSCNVGHQRAIMAGLEHSRGDFIVIIDADLQDPPSLILEMIARLEEGFDIVHAVRRDRSVDSLSKRLSAKLFYLLMRQFVQPDLVENASDFKAFTRPVLVALLGHEQRVLFMRGLTSALGFRQSTIPFTRAPRHAGDSKYPIKKMLRFARDAVLGNTVLPLRLIALPGVFTILATPLYWAGLYMVSSRFSMEFLLIMAMLGALAMLGGFALASFALVAEYLGLIIQEVQRRPRYHLRAIHQQKSSEEAALPVSAPINAERRP